MPRRVRRASRNLVLAAAIFGGSAGGAFAAASCCKPAECGAPAYQGKRIAFVVGVDKYSGPTPFADRLADLTNAVHDATSVAEMFGLHGYQVRCLANPAIGEYSTELAALKDHLQTLQALPEDQRAENSVIVHFSGHGFRVSNSDYVFFTGDHTTQEIALDNALKITDILGRLNEFADLNVFFMFDSCRNFSKFIPVEPPPKPNWLVAGYQDPNTYTARKADRHVLFYSTAAGSLAHDISSETDGKDNGAFVYLLRKYLKLVSLDLLSVYVMVRNDPSMRSINQKPDYLAPLTSDEPFPWAAPDDDCALREQNIAEKSLACVGRGMARATCFTNTVCPAVDVLEKRTTHANGAACSRAILASVFPEIGPCASNVPVANALGMLPAPPKDPALAIPDLTTLRIDAVLSSSIRRVQDAPVPAAANLPPGPRATMRDLVDEANRLQSLTAATNRPASPDRVRALRLAMLLTTQAAGSEAFSDINSAFLQLPSGKIELQLLPAAGTGTTGLLEPTGPAKFDCQTQFCNKDWVMVRVPTKGGIVHGWIAANTLTPRQATSKVEIAFVKDRYQPTRDSLVKLQGLMVAARASPTSVIKVTAVMDGNDDARLLGSARATRISNILSGRATSFDRISVRLIETATFASYPPVTVELFK